MKELLKKTKKVTIDTLAIIMNNGFERLEKKVDNIEKDVSFIKKDITGIKNQLEGTNKRIDDMAVNRVKYEDHNKLKARVDFLETRN